MVSIVNGVLKNRGGDDVEFTARERLQSLNIGILGIYRDQAVDQIQDPSLGIIIDGESTGLGDDRGHHIGHTTTPDHGPGGAGRTVDGAANHVQVGVAASNCPTPGRPDGIEIRVDAIQHHVGEIEHRVIEGLKNRAPHEAVTHRVACRCPREGGGGVIAELEIAIEAIDAELVDADTNTPNQLGKGKSRLGQNICPQRRSHIFIYIEFIVNCATAANKTGVTHQRGPIAIDRQIVTDRG